MGELLLEMRGVVHVWRAGAGACSATVRSLRGVDLCVRAGEVVALAGAPGSGKTTLLLCAAGIACPESGEVIVRGGRHAAYVGGASAWATEAMEHADRGVRVVLLDVLDPPSLASPRAVAALAGRLASAGLAVVVAARDTAALPAFATRLVTLASGRVLASGAPLDTVRVAHGAGSAARAHTAAVQWARGFVARRVGTP